MAKRAELDRRVYTPELQELTGWSNTWIHELEKAGSIPMGRKDPGGRRKFWLSSEVEKIVAGETRAKKK